MKILVTMKKFLPFCVLLLLFCQIAEGQKNLPYISPGYGVSWDFSGHFVSSPKISIGMLAEGGIYYNITVGESFSSNERNYPNIYVETQCGKWVSESSIIGGGIGLTFPNNNNNSRISFRVSACTGFIGFLNATILISDNIQTEIGGQVVLPIPLGTISSGDD